MRRKALSTTVTITLVGIIIVAIGRGQAQESTRSGTSRLKTPQPLIDAGNPQLQRVPQSRSVLKRKPVLKRTSGTEVPVASRTISNQKSSRRRGSKNVPQYVRPDALQQPKAEPSQLAPVEASAKPLASVPAQSPAVAPNATRLPTAPRAAAPRTTPGGSPSPLATGQPQATSRTAALPQPGTAPKTGSSLPGQSPSRLPAAPATPAPGVARPLIPNQAKSTFPLGGNPRRIQEGMKPNSPAAGSPTAGASTAPSTTAPAAPSELELGTSDVPSLQLKVLGPNSLQTGQVSDYTIRLLNHQDKLAEGVFVRISIPEWVEIAGQRTSIGLIQSDNSGGPATRQLVWDVQQVRASGQETMTLSVKPKTDQLFQLKCEWTIRPKTLTSVIKVLKPELRVTINGPTEMVYGDSGKYVVTLSNPGTGPAKNISLRLQPSGELKSFPVLEAGQQTQATFTIKAQQAGNINLLAIAEGSPSLKTQAKQQVSVRRAKLNARATLPPLVFAGSVAKLRVDITNEGDAISRGVAAGIVLPAGAKYLSGLAKPLTEGQQLAWEIGDMRPGDRRSFELLCELTTPGANTIEVRVADPSGLSTALQARTKVEALADLKLLVNDPKGPKQVGEMVTYEIQVINRGTKAAQNINVLAHFSKGLEPSTVNGARADIKRATGQVVFQPIARIEAGQQITLKIIARATTPGTGSIQAEVTCNDPETKLVLQESTRFYGEALGSSQTPAQTSSQPAARTSQQPIAAGPESVKR